MHIDVVLRPRDDSRDAPDAQLYSGARGEGIVRLHPRDEGRGTYDVQLRATSLDTAEAPSADGIGVGSSGGVASATSVGAALVSVGGVANGTSAATGIGAVFADGVGVSTGAATVTGAATAHTDGVGASSGTGTATGTSTTSVSSTASASGTSVASASSDAFPIQFFGLKAYYGAAVHDLCLVATANAPTGMGGAIRINKNGVFYAIYLVEISDINATPIRIQTSTGIKAIRVKT
jgi:hypothetical protein